MFLEKCKTRGGDEREIGQIEKRKECGGRENSRKDTAERSEKSRKLAKHGVQTNNNSYSS